MLELELNDGSILQADDRNARAVQFACLLLASTISAVVTVNVIRQSAPAYHVGVGVTPALAPVPGQKPDRPCFRVLPFRNGITGRCALRADWLELSPDRLLRSLSMKNPCTGRMSRTVQP